MDKVPFGITCVVSRSRTGETGATISLRSLGGLLALALYGQAHRKVVIWQRDWPMYAHDVQGRKFSSLTQINAGNVANLKPASTAMLRTTGAPTAEETPILIHGVMCSPAASKILASEAHTGKEL